MLPSTMIQLTSLSCIIGTRFVAVLASVTLVRANID